MQQILKLKYASKPFGRLSEQEQNAHSIALMMKINVITGWPLPQLPEQENVLAEQLKLYMVESFPLLNVDEITYAIRSYGTAIENWGKNMNLSLIGKALASYESERKELSTLEETKKPQTENLIAPKVTWDELAEAYYQDYLNNRFNIKVMPAEIYGACLNHKPPYVSRDAYEDWLQTAESVLINDLIIEAQGATSENERYELEQKIQKIRNGEHETLVTNMAKKLTIEFLYQSAKKQKRKTLFQ